VRGAGRGLAQNQWEGGRTITCGSELAVGGWMEREGTEALGLVSRRWTGEDHETYTSRIVLQSYKHTRHRVSFALNTGYSPLRLREPKCGPKYTLCNENAAIGCEKGFLLRFCGEACTSVCHGFGRIQIHRQTDTRCYCTQ